MASQGHDELNEVRIDEVFYYHAYQTIAVPRFLLDDLGKYQ